MSAVEEHLVCTCPECRVAFVVKSKPLMQKHNVRCVCGNDVKKVYQSPVLTVYGTLVRPCPTRC